MAIHVARICQRPVLDGVVHDPDTISIATKLRATSEDRILADADLPNTAGFPTIAAYLTIEDTAGFDLRHIDQTYCITQEI